MHGRLRMLFVATAALTVGIAGGSVGCADGCYGTVMGARCGPTNRVKPTKSALTQRTGLRSLGGVSSRPEA
jgi:hypothetical protein